MGSEDFYPEEGPVHEVSVDGFWMDRHLVTNEKFARFIEATGYVTVAERALNPADYPGAPTENLVPGALVFQKTQGPVDLTDYTNWWVWAPGTSWRHPFGPHSSIDGIEQHPVVHIAYEDAEAYARWTGKELPTEAEWERAARGGLEGKRFTWGDEHFPDGKAMANSWQGEFPWQNLLLDRFARNFSRGLFSCQRLWTIRYGGKRVGVDFRLVCPKPRGRSRPGMLRPGRQSAHRLFGQELRSEAAKCSNSAQSR